MKDSEKTGIMEFNEKLQELRKQKALTQEELAEKIIGKRDKVAALMDQDFGNEDGDDVDPDDEALDITILATDDDE